MDCRYIIQDFVINNIRMIRKSSMRIVELHVDLERNDNLTGEQMREIIDKINMHHDIIEKLTNEIINKI